jgi:hypothetical protein
MKVEIARAFNAFADGLVVYSRRHGRASWLIFLIVFASIVAVSFGSSSLSAPARGPRGLVDEYR